MAAKSKTIKVTWVRSTIGHKQAARGTIRALGLVAEVSRVSSSLPKQTVVTQSPASGASAVHGDHVLLTVSVGSKEGKGHGRHRGQHKQKEGTTWESE